MAFEPDELAAPATPALLAQLEVEGRITPEAHAAGVLILQDMEPSHWHLLLNRAFLIVGSVLLLVGIIFFFAYNWANIHRYAKFALLDLALLGTIVVTMRKGLDDLTGKVSLFGSIVLVGALLAVIGQTYQTGADAYQLFLAWMVLVTAWVVVSKMAGAWFFWLILANLSLALFLQQELGFQWKSLEGTVYITSLNAAALVVWELVTPYFKWMQVRANWVQRTLYTAALALSTIANGTLIISHVNYSTTAAMFASLIYLALLGFGVYWYRIRKVDLLPLTDICLSLIVLSAIAMGKAANDFGFFLFITFAVLAEAAAAGFWLKRVNDHVNAKQAV